jgi:hypothetical protein
MTSKLHLPKGRRGLVATAGITATLAVVGVATAPAWAGSNSSQKSRPAVPLSAPASGHSLTAVKQRVDRRIDRGVTAIDRLTAALPRDVQLTAAEVSLAQGDLASLRDDLTALKAKVDGENSVTAIWADVRAARGTVSTNPSAEQGALLLRAAVTNRYLDAVGDRIGRAQTRIDAAKQAGKDVTAAQTALADVQVKVADARSHLAGLAPALLSAQPPAAGFAAAKASLQAVRTDVRAIRQDVKVIRQSLVTSKR